MDIVGITDVATVNQAIVEELTAAGIEPKVFGEVLIEDDCYWFGVLGPQIGSVVDNGVMLVPETKVGVLGDWVFIRDWSYWRATAKEHRGLPVEKAQELNSLHQATIRINGCRNGTSVPCYSTVDIYHIELVSLKDFADFIRENVIPS
ncbi:MAG: hypothetical protein WCX71_05140 [Candidatus Buchananbacteria bacterium]